MKNYKYSVGTYIRAVELLGDDWCGNDGYERMELVPNVNVLLLF